MWQLCVCQPHSEVSNCQMVFFTAWICNEATQFERFKEIQACRKKDSKYIIWMGFSNTYCLSVWFQTHQIQWKNGHKSKIIYSVDISEMKIVVTRQLVYSDVGVASSRSFKDVWRRSLRCWWRQNAQKYRLRWLLNTECQTMKLFWARNFILIIQCTLPNTWKTLTVTYARRWSYSEQGMFILF